MSQDSPTSANPLGAKPKKWAHGGEVPTFTLPNQTIAEGMAAIGMVWDGSAFVNETQHADGGTLVHVVNTADFPGGGGGGGGGAVTVADGADVAQGTTTDTAVVSDATGTVIGFLRGLVKLFAARIPVLGSTTGSASSPVVIASDQAAVATKSADGTHVAIGTTTDAAATTTGTVIAQLRRIANLLAGIVTVKTDQTTHGTTDLVAADITKVVGTALDVNSGTKSAGTPRVVIATDQPALTNAQPAKIASGDDVAMGAIGDAAWASGNGTVIGLLKNIATKLAGSVAVTGTFWQGTQPVSIAAAVAVTDNSGSLTVDFTQPALVAGTAEVGRVGLSKTGTGYSPYLADAITTVVEVRTGAGKFGGCALINLNSAPAYLQCFDVATGTAVTLGTTVPTFVIPLPANSTAANGSADRFALDVGIAVANGLKVAATTTAKGASTVGTGVSGTIYYG